MKPKTVGDVIDALSVYPRDMLCLVDGYEDGYDVPCVVRKEYVFPLEQPRSYEGAYDDASNVRIAAGEGVAAVVVSRYCHDERMAIVAAPSSPAAPETPVDPNELVRLRAEIEADITSLSMRLDDERTNVRAAEALAQSSLERLSVVESALSYAVNVIIALSARADLSVGGNPFAVPPIRSDRQPADALKQWADAFEAARKEAADRAARE